nr:bile acid beta glucosidase [Hymenolepis microstoma]
MDHLNPIKMESIYGVPLGGIGCGTIGRGFRGEFCRSSLRPGIYHHEVNYSDQFIVTVFRNGQVYQKVLSSQTNNSNVPYGLLSWEWEFPADHGHYIGLYPRSWTIYEIPEFDLVLICEQISPVIPHNYKDSCLPLGVFHWTVLNFHPTLEAQVSITMTWRGPRQNEQPPPPQTEQGNAGVEYCDPRLLNSIVTSSIKDVTRNFESGVLRGCLMEACIGYQIACCFGIAAAANNGIQVTRCSGFQFKMFSSIPGARAVSRVRSHLTETTDDPSVSSPSSSFLSEDSSTTGDSSTTAEKINLSNDGLFKSHVLAPLASQFWKDLKSTGALSDENINYIQKGDKKRSSKLAMAVCASCMVPPACGKLPGSSSTSPPGTPCNGSRQQTFSNSVDAMGAGSATLQFFVTWHSPRVHFRSSVVPYRRQVSKFSNIFKLKHSF